MGVLVLVVYRQNLLSIFWLWPRKRSQAPWYYLWTIAVSGHSRGACEGWRDKTANTTDNVCYSLSSVSIAGEKSLMIVQWTDNSGGHHPTVFGATE